jgi:hypothetical protein
MPSESASFTPSSILFRPHQQFTVTLWLLQTGELMVEPPGTAPGSEWLITKAVYRHSRLAPTRLNIGLYGGEKKIDGANTPRGGDSSESERWSYQCFRLILTMAPLHASIHILIFAP